MAGLSAVAAGQGLQGRGGAASAAAIAQRGVAGRSDRLLGSGDYRGLALPDGDAAQGRLRERAAQRGRHEGGRRVGSGERHRRRRTVPRVRRRGHHAAAGAPAHHVAGRQHAEGGHRQREPGPAVPLRSSSAAPAPRAGRACPLASWETVQQGQGLAPAAGGRGNAVVVPTALSGSLKVVTTKMKPGYLRRNGVPYSANAVLTEFFDRTSEPNGDSWLILTSDRGRPGLSESAVHADHALQARAGRIEVPPASVRSHATRRGRRLAHLRRT